MNFCWWQQQLADEFVVLIHLFLYQHGYKTWAVKLDYDQVQHQQRH